MEINAILNGIVIDHIRAGLGMELYKLLKLEELDCSVAIIKNAPSKKLGRKDIIKIDAPMSLNLDVLGLIDRNITVNVIEDGRLLKKLHMELPQQVTDVLKCKNPRCITSTEQELAHVFTLADRERGAYRCLYCEAEAVIRPSSPSR